MAETLREALREQVTLRAVAQWLVAGGILYFLLDPAPIQFITTTVSMGIFGLSELVTDVYDVRRSVRNGGFGVYALVGGAAMVLSDPNVVALPIAFLLVGAWFVVDAVQTARHEGATEDQPTGREVYHDYVGRRVHEALEDGPRTRRELSEALDADDEAVDAALAKLQSHGTVVREGSAFRLDDTDDGGMSARVVGLARRIARPLTLELDREPSDDGGEPTGRTTHRGAPADESDERGDHRSTDRDERTGRERESAD